MKRVLLLLFVALLALAIVVGCGTKQEETDKVPAETKAAEMMDSTRLDSAMTEMVDSAKAVMDNAADSAKGLIKDAIDGH